MQHLSYEEANHITRTPSALRCLEGTTLSNRGQRPRIQTSEEPLPGGQYAAGWVGLFLFIALGRMVTFCKEGGGMFSIWALRARSYKTGSEA